MRTARAALLFAALGMSSARAADPPKQPWAGEEMPLPLAGRTPADLAVKAIAERQYLIFNLLAGGKVAWDRGDFATAASKWESLLRVPNLDPEIDRVIRPMAADARSRAGGRPAPPPPPPPTVKEAAPPSPKEPAAVTVSGTVSGGGSLGPGGTVLWLKRESGATPRPAPARNKVMNQVNKTFVPRVLAVTVGTKVDFRNQDGIFHNVFSLSRPSEFDAGLYKGGESYQKTFGTPGPVQILCNIHASMIGYVVVVDTPYYGQSDEAGSFAIRGVPPGEYVLEAWHESASTLARAKVAVGAEGARGVQVKIGGDKKRPNFVPDKYGKPRQAQLGY
jgi:plastocyanin